MGSLNRNKPYGTIGGCSEGRRFEQDGLWFTADGEPWQPRPDAGAALAPETVEAVEAVVAPAPAKPTAKKAKPSADSPVDEQLQAQLGAGA